MKKDYCIEVEFESNPEIIRDCRFIFAENEDAARVQNHRAVVGMFPETSELGGISKINDRREE